LISRLVATLPTRSTIDLQTRFPMDNSTPLDPDDYLRLPAISGWHEQIVTNVHSVADIMQRRYRPRADNTWREHGVSIRNIDPTGCSLYASRLMFAAMDRPKPRCVPTSGDVAIAYETLRPRIAKNAADWRRMIDPRDTAQVSLFAVWNGLRRLGIANELRPARWTTEPSLPGRHIAYLLTCVDNALTDLKRNQFGSAVPANVTARVASTIPLDAWEQSREDEGRDPTDSWCEWLTVTKVVSTSPYRLTLTMHVAGYTDREIAAQTGSTPATVRQRRSELRQQLRTLLES
jgi:hypothetical protein